MEVDPLHLSAALLIRFLLVFARLGGFFAVLPVFGERTVPGACRAGLAALCAWLLMWVPVGAIPADLPLVALGLMLCRETMVGIAVGYLARLMFSAFQFAINALDVQIGLGFMQLVDPGSQVNLSVLGHFVNSLLLLLFLQADGHHLMLRTLAATYEVAPIGTAMPNLAAIGPVSGMLGLLTAIAIQLALPAVLVLLLIDVAMGIVGRVVPQLNVFLVAMPIKVMVGLATLYLTLPTLSTALAQAMAVISHNVPQILGMVR